MKNNNTELCNGNISQEKHLFIKAVSLPNSLKRCTYINKILDLKSVIKGHSSKDIHINSFSN